MRADRALKIRLLTDVFPPVSGGSGWSAFYLGKALQARGHAVRVLRPCYGEGGARPGTRTIEFRGLDVEELLVPQPPRTATRLGLGRAWEQAAARGLMQRRASLAASSGDADVLHGQHAVSATAASLAARSARRTGAYVVSVATIRDYWSLCPTSTRLFADRSRGYFECKECHRLRAYIASARRSGGLKHVPVSIARWAQCRRSSQTLAQCDAVIAVSGYVRTELARSGRVHRHKLHSIPNLVDLPSVDEALKGSWPLTDIAPGEPFLLFVGKWDPNKGAQMLPEAVARSGVKLPVVFAGDGPLGAQLEKEGVERGLDFRFCPWIANDAAILLMHSATALLFPSAWQEPLSRVLLEGCAAGAAIVALNTGGTSDILQAGLSGWLARDMGEFAAGLRQVVGDVEMNMRLRTGARRRTEEHFSAPVVSAQVERLYRELLAEAGAA